MGFMSFQANKQDEMYHHWLAYCQKSGLPFINVTDKKEWGTYNELGIARPEPLTELVDLDALQHDYRAYAEGCKFRKDSFLKESIEDIVEDIITILDQMKTQSAADYLDMDYANPETADELMQVGLLLGYPIETTVSLIRVHNWC